MAVFFLRFYSSLSRCHCTELCLLFLQPIRLKRFSYAVLLTGAHLYMKSLFQMSDLCFCLSLLLFSAFRYFFFYIFSPEFIMVVIERVVSMWGLLPLLTEKNSTLHSLGSCAYPWLHRKISIVIACCINSYLDVIGNVMFLINGSFWWIFRLLLSNSKIFQTLIWQSLNAYEEPCRIRFYKYDC